MMVTAAPTRWFLCSEPHPAAQIRLFCFPHAGGSALLYRNWADLIRPEVEVICVEPPGRCARLREAPFTSMDCLVRAITEEITELLDKPFAFFGHSMGAAVAFELAHTLRSTHSVEPMHLFVAGHSAPQAFSDRPTYNLPEPEFIEELCAFEGTPAEVVENPELLRLLLPLLRADFELVQTYQDFIRPKLNCPVTALGGAADKHVTVESLRQWSEKSSGAFYMRMFSGNHFFMRIHEKAVVGTVVTHLRRTTALFGSR